MIVSWRQMTSMSSLLNSGQSRAWQQTHIYLAIGIRSTLACRLKRRFHMRCVAGDSTL